MFLVTNDWDVYFGGSVQSLLPRPTLDHLLVLLARGEDFVRGPVPFKFENMWLKAYGFMSLIRDWWQSTEIVGSGFYLMVEKLKALKIKFKVFFLDPL